MARLPELLRFCATHGLKIGTIADLIHYRSRTESLVERVAERSLETVHGRFKLYAYRDGTAGEVHLALVRGEVTPGKEILVRVHEPFSALDALDTASAVHSWNLNEAMRTIAGAEAGVIVLLRRTESAESLLSRVLDEGGAPPAAKMDLRTYGIGAQILKDLGVTRMKIMAQPRKMPSMAGFDLEVSGYLLPEKSRSTGVVTPISERKR
jgi:3,4-dihydroxy 2-butanone 4-phosphate synthase/GTP cyclohydrolase II